MSLTKCLALDIECVGIKGGHSQAARVSVVNENLECVLDTYVAPTHPVIDYRTPVSGIRRHNLVGAPSFSEIREKVRVMLSGRILVGHSLEYDLAALELTHPESDIRDTASYPPFVKLLIFKTAKSPLFAATQSAAAERLQAGCEPAVVVNYIAQSFYEFC